MRAASNREQQIERVGGEFPRGSSVEAELLVSVSPTFFSANEDRTTVEELADKSADELLWRESIGTLSSATCDREENERSFREHKKIIFNS